LYGGAAFSLYPLCVAHANDYTDAADFVVTASGLLLVYGIGAALGPLIAGPLMQYVSGPALLGFIASMHGVLVIFILVRMRQRKATPNEEQEPFVMLARTSQTALEMIAPDEPPADAPPQVPQ